MCGGVRRRVVTEGGWKRVEDEGARKERRQGSRQKGTDTTQLHLTETHNPLV